MVNPTAGLSNSDEVEALADQLSACADQLHARLMKAINSGRNGPGIDRALARQLLDDEAVLRQRANRLYAEAATHSISGLGASQAHIMELTARATEQIATIKATGDLLGLVAAMLSIAGAVAAGQPASVMLALEKIHRQLGLVAADHPASPAPAQDPAAAK